MIGQSPTPKWETLRAVDGKENVDANAIGGLGSLLIPVEKGASASCRSRSERSNPAHGLELFLTAVPEAGREPAAEAAAMFAAWWSALPAGVRVCCVTAGLCRGTGVGLSAGALRRLRLGRRLDTVYLADVAASPVGRWAACRPRRYWGRSNSCRWPMTAERWGGHSSRMASAGR